VAEKLLTNSYSLEYGDIGHKRLLWLLLANGGCLPANLRVQVVLNGVWKIVSSRRCSWVLLPLGQEVVEGVEEVFRPDVPWDAANFFVAFQQYNGWDDFDRAFQLELVRGVVVDIDVVQWNFRTVG